MGRIGRLSERDPGLSILIDLNFQQGRPPFYSWAFLSILPNLPSRPSESYVIYVRTPTSIVEGDRLGECGNALSILWAL